MTWRARLDRWFTITVGISFAIMVPIWLIEWSQDFGVGNVLLAILALFLLGMWRGWPKESPPIR